MSVAERGAEQGLSSRLALCVLAALALLVPGLRAQETAEKSGKLKSDEPALFTTFGWGSVLPADCWAPVVVELSPMDKPVGGTISIEYPQDNTQTARVTVPFATTPGQPTRVQAVAAIPMNASRVIVTAVNDRGRRLAWVTYGSGGILQLPNFVQVDQNGLFVSVGRVGASDALDQWAKSVAGIEASRGRPVPNRAAGKWSGAVFARYEAADLPVSWPAYESLTALIVDADIASDADPRALEAVRLWVRSGGRLVILATAPGDEWRAWLPQDAPLPIALAAPVTAAPPPEVGSAIGRYQTELANLALGDGPRPDPLPGLALAVSQRAITVTGAGRAALWQLRWTDEPESMRATTGLLAEGPVGLGWVTVVGLDPARATEVLSARAAGAIWGDAMQPIVDDLLPAPSMQPGGWWAYRSTTGNAAGAAIERVGRVPIMADSVFVTIALCVLILAVMVGPADFFVLRRLKVSQRSWLTALAWIALAGGASYILPPLIRTQPTQFNRVGVIDAVCEPGSDPLYPEARSGWSTCVSGLYSARSGPVDFENTDPVSWWRGVASPVYYWQGNSRGGAVVPVVQTAAGGAAGSTRGAPLTRMSVPIWTFRTMQDQTEVPLGVRANLVRAVDGWDVTVLGLPREASVTDAVVREGDNWLHAVGAPSRNAATTPQQYPPQFIRGRPARDPSASIEPVHAPIGDHEPGAWTGRFREPSVTPPYAWESNRQQNEYVWYDTDTTDDPGPLLNLQGSLGRGRTIDRYTLSDTHVVLYLRVENWPAAPTLSWDARYRGGRVLRLVVPLPQSTAQASEPST